MTKLVVKLPEGDPLEYELVDATTTIGRSSSNTIHIDDPSVSGHHAQIEKKGDHFFLKDLDSTNGTKINDQKIETSPLNHGNTITFGQITAQFRGETGEKTEGFPEQKKIAITTAAASFRPANFTSISPFPKTVKKKDPVGVAILGLGALSLIASLISILLISSMKIS